MGPARITITALCLAGLVLAPIPGFSKPDEAQGHPSQGQGQGQGQGKGHQEPSPHAGDTGPTPSNPPNDEESNMKSNEGVFAAALLMAIASGAANASDAGIALHGCNSSSGSGTTIESRSVAQEFCVGPITNNGAVVAPKVCTPAVNTPPATIGGASDVYCTVVSSAGSGDFATSVNPECVAGLVITRSGASSWSLDIQKNGVSQAGFPMKDNQPNGTVVVPVCYGSR